MSDAAGPPRAPERDGTAEGRAAYDTARAALYALAPRGILLGLEPVRAALAAMGHPERAVPAVHVAGTNGKGSVSAMVDAALRASGKRVGLYTSPHLHRFAERIRVQGEPARDEVIAAAAHDVLARMDRGEIPRLTFFEATTVVAWEVFRRASLDVVVLEVGLGGRLDATNECAPVVTAITRIARDHEALLGSSLDAIAREKAGILKRGVPCVLGPDLSPGTEAREAIAQVARAVGAELVEAPAARELPRDPASDPLRTEVEIALGDGAAGPLAVALALGGGYQVQNAAVAAGVLARMGVARAHIAQGLSHARWPGRLERVDGLLFDAAHNPDGACALARALDALPVAREARALVFGASSDKDHRAMLAALAPRFDPARRFYCAAAALRRAQDPGALAALAPGLACASVADALSRAGAAVGPAGLVVVCGSIFVVAEARALALDLESDPPIGM